MNNPVTTSSGDDQSDTKFVEALTADTSGEFIGYRFGGGRPGPNALIAADARLIEALSDRLVSLPTLPWMWGQLYLVALDDVECRALKDVRLCLPDLTFDELVMLPYAPGDDTHDISIDRAYWATLRLCRQLGMIQGRGVS